MSAWTAEQLNVLPEWTPITATRSTVVDGYHLRGGWMYIKRPRGWKPVAGDGPLCDSESLLARFEQIHIKRHPAAANATGDDPQ